MIDNLIQNLIRTSLQDAYKSYRTVTRAFSRYPQDSIAVHSFRGFIHLTLLQASTAKQREQALAKCLESHYANYEQLYIANDNIAPEEFFTETNLKKLLILGWAGIGKSTLCQYLALQWLDGHLYQDKFQAVFWLKLRDIASFFKAHTMPENPYDCLWQVLKRLFFNQPAWHLNNEQILKKNFFTWLQQNPVLFLLDGLDEVSELLKDKTHYFHQILIAVGQLGYVLVTSRPLVEELPYQFDRQLACMGFTNENINAFILSYFNQMGSSLNTEELLILLQENPSIWDMAHTPINLEMICWSWYKGALHSIQQPQDCFKDIKTLTQLYTLMLQAIVSERNQERQALKESLGENKTLAKLIDSFLNELSYQAVRASDSVIIEPVLLNRCLLTWLEQQKIEDNLQTRTKLINACHALGLLKALNDNEQTYLQQAHFFVHLSVQEFFAARFLAQHFLQPTIESQAVFEHLNRNKYESRWQLIIRFCAGLLYQAGKKQKNFTGLLAFFNTLLAQPRDVIGSHHLSLLAYCLEECEVDITIPLLAKLIEQQAEYLANWLGIISQEHRWFRTLERCSQLLKTRVIEEVLLNKAKSTDKQDRLNATMLLLKLPIFDSSVQKYLFSLLGDANVFLMDRDILAKALAERNSISSAELVPYLSDASMESSVRKALADVLAKRTDMSSAGLLIYLADADIDSEVRYRLILGLAERTDISSAELLPYLRDANIDSDIRGHLAIALAKRTDISGVELLPYLTNADIDSDIRADLAIALAEHTDVSSAELFSYLTDANIDSDRRGYLAIALAEHTDVSSAKLLPYLTVTDIDSDIRGDLAIALAMRANIKISDLFSYLTDIDIDIQERLARVFAKRTDISHAELLAYLSNVSIGSSVRKVLADGLVKRADISSMELLPFLANATIDGDARGDLSIALAKRADISSTELLPSLADANIDTDKRGELFIALAGRTDISSAKLLPYLADVDFDSDIFGRIAVALAKLKDMNIVELLPYLKDTDIDSDTRYSLVLELAKRTDISSTNLLPYLTEAKIDSNIRGEIAVILAKLNDMCPTQLLPYLKEADIDSDIRGDLAMALAKRTDMGSTELLSYLADATIDGAIKGPLLTVLAERTDVSSAELLPYLADTSLNINTRYTVPLKLTERPALSYVEFETILKDKFAYNCFIRAEILITSLQQTITIENNLCLPGAMEALRDITKAHGIPTSLLNASGYASGCTKPPQLNIKLFQGIQLSQEIWTVHLARKREGSHVILFLESLQYEELRLEGYHLTLPSKERPTKRPRLFSTSSSSFDEANVHELSPALLANFSRKAAEYVCQSWPVAPAMLVQLRLLIQRDFGKSIPYSALGGETLLDSTLASTHMGRRYNCLTWAEEKLQQVGIITSTHWSDVIVTLPYTHLPDKSENTTPCLIM